MVQVLSFNSTVSLNCHLEFFLPSSLYGFNIFIHQLSLAGSSNTGCLEDFVQFGRDILFVTTHVSEKYCGVIDEPMYKQYKDIRNVSFGGISAQRRTYVEENDREMDVWIKIQSEKERTKIVTLVMTPFLKSCGKSDIGWNRCGDRRKCIRKELFCDGHINCEGEGKFSVKNVCKIITNNFQMKQSVKKEQRLKKPTL